MDGLILFVLKSTLISGILFTWYVLALKNKRMHNYNRFFLLFSLYASVQLPLLDFNWSPVYEKPPEIVTSVQMLIHTFDEPNSIGTAKPYTPTNDFRWEPIALGLSALVSLGLLLTMFTRIRWLLRTGKRYPITVVNGIKLIQTDLPQAPFSFMNRIFWRTSLSLETEYGRMIFRHELVHIQQRHSYDKLASQLLTCLLWMNPFYWLIQKELSMVHEFIADEQAVLNNEAKIQKEEYASVFVKMLLEVNMPGTYLAPEHYFFNSPIKRRIMMIQKNKTVQSSVLRRAAVLPIIAGSIFIFAFSPQLAPKPTGITSPEKIILVIDAGHGGHDEGCRSGTLIEKTLNLKLAKRMMELAPAYNIEVHLTRSHDENVSPEARVAFANNLHPDDFISIHVNDEPGKATGKGTFDITINDKTPKAADSKRLAHEIYKSASRHNWEQKKLYSEKNPYVLRENTSAALLIEIGDIKNKQQMQYFDDDTKLNELCNNILEAVVEANKP